MPKPKMVMVELDMGDMMLALESVIRMLYDAKQKPQLLNLLPPTQEHLLHVLICATAENKLRHMEDGDTDKTKEAAAALAAATIAKAKGA